MTSAHGALLVVDEIQTGIGRTGDWFAHQPSGIVPDAMTLAKGLGGGVPIGALVTFGPDVTALLAAGQHGTTFGGNPLACAAGLAVLDTIERDHLLDHVRDVAALLDDVEIEGVSGTRGRGLLRAIELDGIPAPAVMAAARDAGFIVNAVTPTALRLAPPLVISADELQGFLDALPAILEAAQRRGSRRREPHPAPAPHRRAARRPRGAQPGRAVRPPRRRGHRGDPGDALA